MYIFINRLVFRHLMLEEDMPSSLHIVFGLAFHIPVLL